MGSFNFWGTTVMLVSWAKALALPIQSQKLCWILLGGTVVESEKTKYVFISHKPSVRQDHNINI